MRILLASRCYCVESYVRDYVPPISNNTISAKAMEIFSSCARINMEGDQLLELIKRWWNEPSPTKLRNKYGDLISAEARCMGITTNMETEATTIVMALRRC
ncbi:hypothetical protein H5410_000932 [Solanum commersonii]|uniref:Uncharacterized protein n=1 Tax=Solanum commersonii TaxID=4109 RepID=A0A9J6AYN6_SOLCO|nr:hypothetical protein H5410_000932 [Solanum commersonii]